MKSIQDLLAALVVPNAVAEVYPPFFCAFDPSTAEILGISSTKDAAGKHQSFEIPHAQGVMFLDGRESFSNWRVDTSESGLVIKKKEYKVDVGNRVDMIPMMQLNDTINSTIEFPEVTIEHHGNILKVHYNGTEVLSWTKPLRLFVTKEGDPTYLLLSFKLDAAILSHLVYENQLNSWPNPVVIELPDSDISIFSNRYTHQIRLKTYENTYN